MRKVYVTEKKKHGCIYCTDMVLKGGGSIRTHCPHEQCPYQVLDKYDSYEDYIASDDSKIQGMVFPDKCDGMMRLAIGKNMGKKRQF